MASRLTRQSFSATVRAARSVRSNVHPAKRFMSADATAGHHHEFKPKSDMPWIIGAAVIAGPALAYLLRDTMEIKRKIAAGHHGHDSHDAHAAHEEKHDDHASKAVAKEDEGEKTEASSTNAGDDAAKADESTPDAAAEPPKEEKESEKNEKEEESK